MSRRIDDCPGCHGTMQHERYAEDMCPEARDRVKARNRANSRAAYRSGRKAERYAAQLETGTRILSGTSHHQGMAVLKAQMGDPRPSGMQLSLVNFDSSDAYWGYAYYKHERIKYRLSLNPDDYRWESKGDNARRDAARRARDKPQRSGRAGPKK